MTLRAPAAELGRLIDLSPLTFVRNLAKQVALLHPIVFVVLVMVFEVSIAVAAALPVAARRLGYLAALVFFVILAPLIGWYALTNLIWAVPVLFLLRYDRAEAGGRAA